MIGEDFKKDADEAYAKYVSEEEDKEVNDNDKTPPKDEGSKAEKTGIKAFLKDFNLKDSMTPLTLLKIYGDFNNGTINKYQLIYIIKGILAP